MSAFSIRRTLLSRRPAPRPLFLGNQSTTSARRNFQTSTRVFAAKDSQDKDSLKPEPNEYSKSGSDAQSAQADNAAFDPDTTQPEQEKRDAGKGSSGDGDNPLEVSPANQEVSQPNDPQKGGAEGSPAETGQGKSKSSGGGSPKKQG